MSEEKNDVPKKAGKLKKILKFVFNSAIVKGVIKSVPFGSVVYDIGDNISHEIAVKNETAIVEKPHSWLTITITILSLGAIVYAFVSKQITVQEVIDLLSSFIPE